MNVEHIPAEDVDMLPCGADWQSRHLESEKRKAEIRDRMGSPTDDNQFMQYTYQWLVPVNLDEVDHLEIGTAQIALP